MNSSTSKRWWTIGLAIAGLLLSTTFVAPDIFAQDRPSERELRTYIPPDQLVSFRSDTPMSQFIEFINPIFERETGKTIVDPEDRDDAIGVSVSGAYFFDAFESVLQYHNLTFEETDRFYMIRDVRRDEDPAVAEVEGEPELELPADIGTREIKIDAILFDLNLTRAREMGMDWNVLFGGQQQGGSGTGGGGQTGTGGRQGETSIFVRTEDLFDQLGDMVTGPEQMDMGTLTRLFRLLENEGAGETVANPTVTVQSAEEGRIQVGSDVPVQTRDFAGNTVTEFFSTGIIVNVVPTLIQQPREDVPDADDLNFVHMDVEVENSSSSPSAAGPVISRNTANTQVLLLDGEQTVIGGLYSTDETVNRRGIPVLKDLPPWFFGLRYVFGYDRKDVTQRELLIVLQARIIDTLEDRADRPFDDDAIDQRRREVEDNLRRMGDEILDHTTLPERRDQENN